MPFSSSRLRLRLILAVAGRAKRQSQFQGERELDFLAAHLGHLGEEEDSSTLVVEGFDLDFLLGREHGEFHEIMVLFGVDLACKGHVSEQTGERPAAIATWDVTEEGFERFLFLLSAFLCERGVFWLAIGCRPPGIATQVELAIVVLDDLDVERSSEVEFGEHFILEVDVDRLSSAVLCAAEVELDDRVTLHGYTLWTEEEAGGV